MPSAGPPAPPTPLLPSTNGSSISARNWSISLNAPCCAPVAGSPESSVRALVRLLPVSPNALRKFGGQRAAVVEEAVERGGDVELVLVQAAVRQRLLSRCRGLLCQHRGQVQDRVGAGIAQRRSKTGRQARGREAAERAAAPARRRQDR